MAVLTITTTAGRIDSAAQTEKTQGLAIRVIGAETVYLGGSAVTSADGFPVETGESFAADIGKDQELWAVTASGTSEIRVFETGI